MLPEQKFLNRPLSFWAYVRLISERLGYYQEADDQASGDEAVSPPEESAVVTVESGGEAAVEVSPVGEQFADIVTIDDLVRCLTTVSVRLTVRFRPETELGDGIRYDESSKSLVVSGGLSKEMHEALTLNDPRKGWHKAIANLGRLAKAYPPIDISEIMVQGQATKLGKDLVQYLNLRLRLLRDHIEPNLMDKQRAEALFNEKRIELEPRCELPMNKQKAEKKHHAFLTGIVNMLTEQALGGVFFDDNPHGLVTITVDGKPFRAMSRWLDGAYPHINNPTAVWEVKEYYGTTTFGSRVADGVYETMLDGMEFAELREHGHVFHYLIVDDRFTWWVKGKSYLCRLVDILHMGLVDEILIGREVLERWPEIVRSWPRSTK